MSLIDVHVKTLVKAKGMLDAHGGFGVHSFSVQYLEMQSDKMGLYVSN